MASYRYVDPISETEFPASFLAADRHAQVGQQRLLTATGVRLVALVSAAVFGALSLKSGHVDLAAFGAATALIVALVTEVYLLTVRPDRHWYAARAMAESVKSLAWRYLVGGRPFTRGSEDGHHADELLLRRFGSITDALRGVVVAPPPEGGLQITGAMRQVRAMSLDERRHAYTMGRINDQRSWYASRALLNERRAARWSVVLAVVEAIGLVCAVLKAAQVINIDLAGVAGGLAAAGVAWLQTRQHHQLASAYAVAAQELADIASRVDWPETEAEWAHFVDEAEEAISREHTLWWASHS
ncbi:DUF4231 domain-containing protein [Actinomadura montaniterrae]|uniref:DUF4231 domain-containing protein n=1 Tax=Actinomadura montaniterrae TaxID=1803903 RepID=A0A6L3W0N8_9ACTN|nr:DUF4231 domain-containing protein [Actinomadura montaniterrae]KAB2380253.1 DUF4231 domain-containing protein [Actinomadura montaniterrae]